MLDLIEKKPYGLLPSIDEELRIPNGCVSSWLDKVFDRHKGTPEFAEVRSNKQLFQIKHYAGEVVYESNGFLAKNKDRLVDDAFLLLSKSKFGFLAQMFPASALDNVAGKASGRNVTLGAKFRGQLSTLMTTLNATEPHYIRCIKPNPNKAPLEFVGEMSLKQLRYAGVCVFTSLYTCVCNGSACSTYRHIHMYMHMHTRTDTHACTHTPTHTHIYVYPCRYAGVFEAVKIRKQGYPFRLTHMEFFRRYKCVYPQDHPWAPRVLDNIQHIIKDMQLDTTQIQVAPSSMLACAHASLCPPRLMMV